MSAIPPLAAALLLLLLAVPTPRDSRYALQGADFLLTEEDGLLAIQGVFDRTADPPDSLTYRMEVVREAPAGRSRSRQGGGFEPRPGRPDTLSAVTISVEDGDRLRLSLEIHHAGVVVAKARREGAYPQILEPRRRR